MQSDYNWYKLDNAALLFPAVSTVSATNVFRLTVRLTEDVSPEILQKAVMDALQELPTFKIRIHKGIFWYYFETNTNDVRVHLEDSYPCRKLEKTVNNGYLFDVTYFGKYINIEFFHALCDGTGASEFFSKVIIKYYKIKLPSEMATIPEKGIYSAPATDEDSFLRVTRDGTVKGENLVKGRAYTPSSILTQNGEIRTIKGILSVTELKTLAKSKNCTITQLLVSILIISMYNECFMFEPSNRSIDVCVPVNLRRFFPSNTLRNFFTTVGVGVNFSKESYTLDEVIEKVSADLTEQLSVEHLYPKIMYCTKAQTNIFLRFVPLFIKNIVLRAKFAQGENAYSMVLSNLGQFKVPDDLKKYIDRFEFLLSPTMQSRYKVSAVSYEDKIVIAFTTNVENTELQRRFFTTLASLGVESIISCNNVSETAPVKKPRKHNKKGQNNEVL